MAGDSYALAPSLISRRRYFPGVRPGSFEQGLPRSLDLDRRVFVSVMVDAASRTVPFSDRQRQFISQMATRRAPFRRRNEPIQRQIGPPVPFRLIFQFAEDFPERRIRNQQFPVSQ